MVGTIKQFHAGYILTGINQYFSKQVSSPQWDDLLLFLSTFDVEGENYRTNTDDPVFVVVDNLISRGQPTIPSTFIEDIFASVFLVTQKSISGRTGSITYDLQQISSDRRELLERAFYIIDPRLKTTDKLYYSIDSWENHPGSQFEEDFLYRIAPNIFGPYCYQILEPQRPIKSILQHSARNEERFRQRLGQIVDNFYDQRVDCAVQFPKSEGFKCGLVIEIDGPQHNEDEQRMLDNTRDRACREAGWEATVRINTDELQNIPLFKVKSIKDFLRHPYAEKVKKNYEDAIWNHEFGIEALQLALSPFGVARIQKVITLAVLTGALRLDQESWNIAIVERDVPCARLAIEDYKMLLYNIFQLEGKQRKLPEIHLRIYNTLEFQNCQLNNDLQIETYGNNVKEFQADLLIDIALLQRHGLQQPDAGFLRKIEAKNCYIVRSSYAPVEQRIIKSAQTIQYNISEGEEQPSLIYFLQNIFRKNTFWPDQLKILRRTLCLEDTIALLPTGAGKSLTYQLSGLLQPGIVLIIDPLKSLMNDQHDNLVNAGIDIAAFINSSQKPIERNETSLRMTKGYYQFIFISPERLQIQEFRDCLNTMDNLYFTYCVIDEAHCVSEWGHDFRTAYLRLAKNARKYCRTAVNRLPIIALTGTASFDVLEDVKIEADIGIGDESAIVRPERYEREELGFTVIDAGQPAIPNRAQKPKIKKLVALQKRNILIQHVTDMAGTFGYDNVADFLSRDGAYPNTGIIFCPHVTGGFGVKEIASHVKNTFSLLDNTTGIYHGGSNDDENNTEELEKTQRGFKNNDLTLLIATKAFGMGIDKPNIRFTIHFNMPQSIESFYQEAGRAGRDRQQAVCSILYSSTTLHDQTTVDKSLMLSFHRNSFPNRDREALMLYKEVLQAITFPRQQNVAPAPGIEMILDNMTMHRTREIYIGFENDKIDQITNYLTQLDNRWSRGMVSQATEYCADSGEFIQRLNLQFRKNIRDDFPLNEGQRNHIGTLFKRIRKPSDTFKSVYRLSLIGVIDDYSVDYSSKTVTATISKKSDSEYKQQLTNYISKYVSREEALNIPNEIDQHRGNTVIQKCVGYLLDFVYSRIAAKRLEAMNQMEEAIRVALAGNNEEFQRFINTYFDSRYTPQLYNYIREYGMDNVWEFIENTEGNPDALRHLYGACNRLLVDNPENAMFLLLRSLAGLLISVYRETFMDDYRKGWMLLKQKYDWSQEEYLNNRSRYKLLAVGYDAEVEIYLGLIILKEHIAWLKDFNTSFLEGWKNESNIRRH